MNKVFIAAREKEWRSSEISHKHYDPVSFDKASVSLAAAGFVLRSEMASFSNVFAEDDSIFACLISCVS